MCDENLRSEPRFAANEPVNVRTCSDDGWCVAGQVMDFSVRGLAVLLPRAIAPTTTVIVEHKGAYLIGTVLHSVPTMAEAFRVGIRLESLSATRNGINQLADITKHKHDL